MKNTLVASCDNLDPDTIENEAVPPSIGETYERGLVKVKINRVLVTNKTLKLVPAARRSLTTKGMAITIAVTTRRDRNNSGVSIAYESLTR